jgi:hypothetical protein
LQLVRKMASSAYPIGVVQFLDARHSRTQRRFPLHRRR